ncbi:hypothetical protein P7L87_24875, partial [Vibrio parahaemolyticus]|nr:hypothetical protein [Vibrio parahaemolyticus]
MISATPAEVKTAIKLGNLAAHKLTEKKILVLVDDLKVFVKNLPLVFTGTVSAIAMTAAIGIAGMTAAPAPAAAQSTPNVTYTAPGGLWHDPAHWSGGNVPTAADHVGISGGRLVTVDRDGAVSGYIDIDASSLSVSTAPSSPFLPGNLHSGTVTAADSSVMVSRATWVNTGLAVRGGTVQIDRGSMQTNGDVSLTDINPSAVLGGLWHVSGTFSLTGIGTEVSLENGASFQTGRLHVAGGSLFVRGPVSSAVASSANITNSAVSVEQDAP